MTQAATSRVISNQAFARRMIQEVSGCHYLPRGYGECVASYLEHFGVRAEDRSAAIRLFEEAMQRLE
jgi:hypothetical protein